MGRVRLHLEDRYGPALQWVTDQQLAGDDQMQESFRVTLKNPEEWF